MTAEPTDLPTASTQDAQTGRPLGTWLVGGVAGLVAGVAWLLSLGLLRASATGHLPPRAAVRLSPAFAPMPVEYAPDLALLAVVPVTVLVVLVAAGIARTARHGTVSPAAVALSGWFAACLAGVAGAAVDAASVAGRANPVYDAPLIASEGATWGVVWGWAVGLVLLLALRRGTAPRRRLATPSATAAAAAAAGLLAAAGWAASGWLLERVVTEVGYQTQARSQVTHWALALLPNPAGQDLAWFGPAYVRAYLLGAAALGVVVAAAVVVAGRGTVPRHGGGLLVLVAWWASVVGGIVATGVAAVGASSHLQDAQTSGLSDVVSLYVGSSMWQGSGWGLMYGWLVGLVGWFLLRLVNRTSDVADEPPAPATDVREAAKV